MNIKISILTILLGTALIMAACQTQTPATGTVATQPPAIAPTTVPPTPTEVPATAVPPTVTAVPPSATPSEVPPMETETPIPEAIVIGDVAAADGCTVVELNPDAWGPLFSGYTAGSDPFFQIHTNDPAFHFNVELYTVYGGSWTGQTGSFPPDCSTHGICVYLVPDAVNAYLATAGEVEINMLSQTGGILDLPINLKFRDLTFEPVPGSGATGCYHVEEVEIEIEE